MFLRTLIAIGLALAITTPSDAAPKSPTPRQKTVCHVGISLNITEGGNIQGFIKDVLAVKAMGTDLQFVSVSWRDLEPKPGEYNWKPILDSAQGLAKVGYHEIVTIKTIDTNQRNLPDDLKTKAFDDPKVISRFRALLAALIPQLPKQVHQISLGNEVDAYLAEHPAETEAFARLMAIGEKEGRRLRPGLGVGVTTTFNGMRDRPDIVRRVNAGTDCMFITYYPLKPDFTVQPVSVVPADFAGMLHTAGAKPLVLQEIGYPADTLLNSSDALQAQFIDAVFAQIAKHRAKIAVANFFILYDLNKSQLETFTAYYGLPDARFRAYLGTLGLKRANGTPRPAWARFEKGVKEMTAH